MNQPATRSYSARLAFRFAIILALALLPAGFIAFIQTKALENEITVRTEISLMGATVQSALAETGLIRRVRGLVAGLASAVPYVVDDPAACKNLIKSVLSQEPRASLVAFIPLSGIMTCASSDSVYDFSDTPAFKHVVTIKAPYLGVNARGPVSGTSVLWIAHPVFDTAGAYIGFVSISLPHKKLREVSFEQFDDRRPLNAPALFWTFDGEGKLLTSNIDLDDAKTKLPADRSLQQFVGKDASIFKADSGSGVKMTYAVVPIVDGDLYLMSSFPTDVTSQNAGFSAYLPTLLMWLVGLLVAGFAAELLVTRHVRTLNNSIIRFARGDRLLQPIELKNAPVELRELATAYLAMTESVTRSEAELEDTVHQKEVLLREVHHRVKNNLQLISSIMNIQIRSAHSDEAKNLLRNLQERIMSLATVHRGLYQTSGLADVRARELIPDIVRQIMSMSSGPENPFETQNAIDDLRLVPDQAVPLSLLLAEALTNAMKHAGASRGHPGRLTVRLKRSGGSNAVLEVINSWRDRDEKPLAMSMPDSGIGSQLITAFVQQLGGKQEFGKLDGEYHLRVTFEVAPLAMAESRQSPDESGDQEWNASRS